MATIDVAFGVEGMRFARRRGYWSSSGLRARKSSSSSPDAVTPRPDRVLIGVLTDDQAVGVDRPVDELAQQQEVVAVRVIDVDADPLGGRAG